MDDELTEMCTNLQEDATRQEISALSVSQLIREGSMVRCHLLYEFLTIVSTLD